MFFRLPLAAGTQFQHHAAVAALPKRLIVHGGGALGECSNGCLSVKAMNKGIAPRSLAKGEDEM